MSSSPELPTLILSLIRKIPDPSVRTDIASTINFLKDLYESGHISEEQLRSDLREVIETVLEYIRPDLTREEIENEASKKVEEFVRAIKLGALKSRMLRTRGFVFRRRGIE